LGAGPGGLRLLVGGTAGSSSDGQARAFAAFLERHLPQDELGVVNLPGHAGLAAYQALAAAAPDGSTLGWASTPSLPARSIDGVCAELMTQVRLIGAVQREPIALVAPVAGSDPMASFRRAVDAGDPFGTPPAGSPSHLAALRLADGLGVKLNLVVFPSVGAVRQAVLDGNVEAATMALGEAIGALREGRMSGLGVASEQEASAFPQLPPLRENGIDLTAHILRGIAAPSAMPAARVATLTAGLQEVTGDPEYRAYADANGFEVVWLEGSVWTLQTMAERSELLELWQRTPWAPEGKG
jgi:tripartite-type tricarboxylate transporter receptor subunit TctC